MKIPLTVLSTLLIFLTFFLSCQKKESTPQTQPPPVVDTSYSLKVYNFNIPILSDTIKKEWNDSLNLRWEFNGSKHFEILLDNVHLTFDTIGKHDFLLLEKTFVLSFQKYGITIKKLVVAVGAKPIPSVTLTISVDSVPLGGSDNIGYTFVGDSCIVSNGVLNHKLPNSIGTFSTGALFQPTTFSFTAYKRGVTATATTFIKIMQPTTADSLFGTWLEKDLLYKPQGSTEFTSVIEDCEKDDYIKLMPNYRYEEHQGLIWCPGKNSELWSSGVWLLLPNRQINIGGNIYTFELTNTSLILTIPNGGGITKVIYEKQ